MKTSFSYEKIRKKGYKITSQRKIVIDILIKAGRHLSADEIYLRAKKENSNIGLTTVYRTLDLLEALGYVKKYDFGEGRARYELSDNFSRLIKHHHHLVCIICNKVIDYAEFVPQETELMEKSMWEISKKYGFDVKTHIVQFYGICKQCQKRKK